MSEHKEITRRILCVQGEIALVADLKPWLPEVQFTAVSDAGHALVQARDAPFDLYLIAEQLPDMAGIELCRQLRRTDAQTPMLLCVHSLSNLPPADQLGIQGYLQNPLNGLVTPNILRAVLGAAAARSTQARIAARAAISEELRSTMQLTATKRALLIYDVRMMAKALDAFSRAGGTPADFKRMWPDIFEEARADVERN